MAASFFQGTLGQFTAYSALGQLDRASQDGSGGRSQMVAEPVLRNEPRANEIDKLGYRVSGSPQQEVAHNQGRLGKANV
ncbi:hypothetical protein QT894_18220, partial [Xanthomonas fragariae]|nr:hypothetical protein [Xanthomonas fragariae]MDM7583288.1 hypothetical protein [Xanthomonas fragariae]